MGMEYLSEFIKLSLDDKKCTGCMMCVNVCPHGVFEFFDKKAHIKNKKACMECGACQKNCPAAAIESGSGVGCAYAIIRGMINNTAPDCDCSGGGGSCCG